MLCNFIEITLRPECSPVNLLHILRTPFPRNTSGWLLGCLFYLFTLLKGKMVRELLVDYCDDLANQKLNKDNVE